MGRVRDVCTCRMHAETAALGEVQTTRGVRSMPLILGRVTATVPGSWASPYAIGTVLENDEVASITNGTMER
jgi:hypothetical protein